MSSAIESGTQLGPYEIKKQLGAGGMGEVWLARDARLGREVAIKVLPPQFAADPERLARFDQEARAAAALNHPHIAVVHDIGHEDGTYFMVQERLEGQTLRALLESGRPALGKTLDLCLEIAEALAAAHGAGIVHRDLKPENVFVSKDGHAKVLDFGLAKLMELSAVASPGGASMSPTMVGTVAGQVMGTAGYMAPEQIEGGEIDHRADIFAFGIVLYEMATGRQPFAGRNVVDTLSLITNEPAPDLAEVDESLPRELQRILHKALAKDPAGRYQSAADLVVDLRGLAADVEADRAVSVAASTGLVSVAGYPPWMLAVGMGLALVAGLVVAWTFSEPARPVPPQWVFEYPYPDGQTHPGCCGPMVEVAPDGSYFVYVAQLEDERQLFIRRRGEYESTPIAGAVGQNLTVSPDGEWIGFYGSIGGSRGLYKVALAGGEPFQLTDGDGVGFFASWGDDGWIYYRSDNHEISRVPEFGGDAETITVLGLNETEGLNYLSWLPGGHLLASVENNSSTLGVGTVAWESGEWREIAAEGSDPRWARSGHVLFNRGGTLYAVPFDPATITTLGPAVPVLQGLRVDPNGGGQFALSDEGTMVWHPGEAAASGGGSPRRLVATDHEGRSEPIGARVEPFRSPRLSPDGRRIAVSMRGEDGPDVWILEMGQGVVARLTIDGGNTPIWSPDGQWIYFANDAGSDGSIWRVAADFSGDPELVLEAAGGRPASIRPDGSTMLFERRTEDGWDIMAAPLTGEGDPVPVVARAAFREWGARYSPDGDYIAYVSNESGQVQVYLRQSDGTRRWLVSPGSGFSPTWSPDGRKLYFASRRGGIHVVEVAFEPEVSIGPPVPLFPRGSLSGPAGVLRDGRLLMTDRVVVDDEGVADPGGIRVVPNWFDELNRLAPAER